MGHGRRRRPRNDHDLGHKYRVDENNLVIGGEPGITITLKLVEPWSLLPVLVQEPYRSRTRERRRRPRRGRIVLVPRPGRAGDLPPDASNGLDLKVWWIQRDAEGEADGIINGVVPGQTARDFYNFRVPGDGTVMYLNKTVTEGCWAGTSSTAPRSRARQEVRPGLVQIDGKEQTYNFGAASSSGSPSGRTRTRAIC